MRLPAHVHVRAARPDDHPDLDAWRRNIDDDIATRCEELLGPGADVTSCETHVRVYGRDGVMGPMEPDREQLEGHEAFLVVDVVAPGAQTRETATSVI